MNGDVCHSFFYIIFFPLFFPPMNVDHREREKWAVDGGEGGGEAEGEEGREGGGRGGGSCIVCRLDNSSRYIVCSAV